MINTDLDCVTFKVEIKEYGKGYYAVAAPDDLDRRGFSTEGSTEMEALLKLYSVMTSNFCSFRLQVLDCGQVVQELVYRERHQIARQFMEGKKVSIKTSIGVYETKSAYTCECSQCGQVNQLFMVRPAIKLEGTSNPFMAGLFCSKGCFKKFFSIKQGDYGNE